jgi:hypothetical protein
MTPDQLDVIEARVFFLPQGPWDGPDEDGQIHLRGVPACDGPTIVSAGCGEVVLWGDGVADFVVRSHEDVPALVAEVRFLRSKLAVIEKLGPVACEDWDSQGAMVTCSCPSHIAARGLRGES